MSALKCETCGGELERVSKEENGIVLPKHHLDTVTICRVCTLEPYLLKREIRRITLLLSPIIELAEQGILTPEQADEAIHRILEREGAYDLMGDE